MWPQIILFVVSLAISYANRPKPQNAKPAGLSDFTVPTAQDGRALSVLFGTRDISGPNVVWYGHLKVVAIRKKA